MTIEQIITLDDGYVIEIHYDEDAVNPFKDFDGSPTLVLHDKAEKRYGWTNDGEWHTRLNCALEDAIERVAPRWNSELRRRYISHRLYGLEVVRRWARAFWGVRVMLPVGAAEHSTTWVYIGTGRASDDPGGWDSGWVGWLFATAEQIEEWGFHGDDEALERSLRASFTEFAAYVEGSVFGYIVKHEDGHAIDDDSCWGFYGSNSYDERMETEFVIGQLPQPGWTIKWRGQDRKVKSVETRLHWWYITYEDGVQHKVMAGDVITLVHPGHMREQFMEVVEHDRHVFVEAEEARARAEDEDNVEIAEMAAAELGALV